MQRGHHFDVPNFALQLNPLGPLGPVPRPIMRSTGRRLHKACHSSDTPALTCPSPQETEHAECGHEQPGCGGDRHRGPRPGKKSLPSIRVTAPVWAVGTLEGTSTRRGRLKVPRNRRRHVVQQLTRAVWEAGDPGLLVLCPRPLEPRKKRPYIARRGEITRLGLGGGREDTANHAALQLHSYPERTLRENWDLSHDQG
jgi:hypothetical protein